MEYKSFERRNMKDIIYKFIGGKRNNKYCHVDRVYYEGDLIKLPKHTNKTKKGARYTFGEINKIVTYKFTDGVFKIYNKIKIESR